MSSGSGAVPGRAAPAACAMRPQLGSPPCSAVFTSGELATARAAASALCTWPPRTITRAIRDAPSPSLTIMIASERSSASSASPKRSSSSLPCSTRTPLAPEHIKSAVSLVESWPSTEVRSNERSTHTLSNSSAVSAASTASVSRKHSIVAKRGEIMPAPLHWALMRTEPDGRSSSRFARFWNRSVVWIARWKSASPCALRFARASRMPFSIASTGR